MRNTLAIAQRELQSFFVSPVAYIVMALFLVVSGLFFYAILQGTQQASLRVWASNLVVLLLFLTPAITMRLLAEEQRSGTIELLLTSPVQDWEVVVGKWLAGVAFFVIMLFPTLLYLGVLALVGSPDYAVSAVGYFGILMFGATLLAIGTFTSSLTQNQIISYVICFAILIVLFVFSGLAGSLHQTGWVSDVFNYLTLSQRLDDLSKGVIDTRDIVYFVSIIGLSLFLATRVLESRRYR